jgi:hypothetical protein
MMTNELAFIIAGAEDRNQEQSLRCRLAYGPPGRIESVIGHRRKGRMSAVAVIDVW